MGPFCFDYENTLRAELPQKPWPGALAPDPVPWKASKATQEETQKHTPYSSRRQSVKSHQKELGSALAVMDQWGPHLLGALFNISAAFMSATHKCHAPPPDTDMGSTHAPVLQSPRTSGKQVCSPRSSEESQDHRDRVEVP